MEELARGYDPVELNRIGFELYEKFRPEIPGNAGWGAKRRWRSTRSGRRPKRLAFARAEPCHRCGWRGQRLPANDDANAFSGLLIVSDPREVLPQLDCCG